MNVNRWKRQLRKRFYTALNNVQRWIAKLKKAAVKFWGFLTKELGDE